MAQNDCAVSFFRAWNVFNSPFLNVQLRIVVWFALVWFIIILLCWYTAWLLSRFILLLYCILHCILLLLMKFNAFKMRIHCFNLICCWVWMSQYNQIDKNQVQFFRTAFSIQLEICLFFTRPVGSFMSRLCNSEKQVSEKHLTAENKEIHRSLVRVVMMS